MNIYEIATGPNESGAAIEMQIHDGVRELKRRLAIPVAVKLGPFFTAFGHFAEQLDRLGADGLVLFNRFYQPDVDLETMTAVPRLELSTSAELLLRLRWTAILHARVRASIVITGDVATPTDGIKAILSGAHAVQVVSAVLRHGPAYFAVLRDGLARWLEAKHLSSLADARGKADGREGDASLWERGSYIRTLQSWPGSS